MNMTYPMEFTESEIFVIKCALERQADRDDDDPGLHRLAAISDELFGRFPIIPMNWAEFVSREVK